MSENATKWVLKWTVGGKYIHRKSTGTYTPGSDAPRWTKKQRKARRFDTAEEARDYRSGFEGRAIDVVILRLTPKKWPVAPEPLRTPTQIAEVAAAMTARWEAASPALRAATLAMERIDGYGHEYRKQWLAGVPNPVGFDEMVAEIGSEIMGRKRSPVDIACPRCAAYPSARCVHENGEPREAFHMARVKTNLVLTDAAATGSGVELAPLPLDIACPTCGAIPGQKCRENGVELAVLLHAERGFAATLATVAAPPLTSFTVACPYCSAPPFLYCVDRADPDMSKPGSPRLVAHDERFVAAGLRAPAAPVVEATHPEERQIVRADTIPRAFADSLAKMFGFAVDATIPEERQRLLAMVDRVRSGSKREIDELGRHIDLLVATALGRKAVASNWTLVVKEIYEHRVTSEGTISELHRQLAETSEKLDALRHKRPTNER